MSAINSTAFIGRIVQDAQLRTDTFATFSIAVNKKWKDDNGERHSHTDYFDLTLSGARAKSLAPHLTKGRLMAFHCEARNNEYKDTAGNKRRGIQFAVIDLEFIPDGSSAKKDGEAKPAAAPAPLHPAPQAQPAPAAEIPF